MLLVAKESGCGENSSGSARSVLYSSELEIYFTSYVRTYGPPILVNSLCNNCQAAYVTPDEESKRSPIHPSLPPLLDTEVACHPIEIPAPGPIGDVLVYVVLVGNDAKTLENFSISVRGSRLLCREFETGWFFEGVP